MKQIVVLLTDKQHEKLKKRAKEKEVRMSEQIRRAVEDYLKKEGENV